MTRQTRRYIDDYPVLDVTALHKQGYVKPNTSGESSCKSRERVKWAFSWHCMDNSIKAAYALSGGDSEGNYQHEMELITQSVNYAVLVCFWFVHVATLNVNRSILFLVTQRVELATACTINLSLNHIKRESIAS